MSRFFEAYLPQIQNLLRTHSKPNSFKKYSSSSYGLKISKTKAQHVQIGKLGQTLNQKKDVIKYSGVQKKQAAANNYNIFSANYTDKGNLRKQEKEMQVDQPKRQRKQLNFDDDHEMEQDQQIIVQKQAVKIKPKVKNPYRTFTQQLQSNTYPFSKRKEPIKSKPKISHEQLRQTLIKTATNQKQSQRLEVIFDSARKFNKLQSHNLTQVSNRKQNGILNPIKVDEVSRRILRKSFCLQMIDDDQEWDRVVTNSKKKWNDQQIHKY